MTLIRHREYYVIRTLQHDITSYKAHIAATDVDYIFMEVFLEAPSKTPGIEQYKDFTKTLQETHQQDEIVRLTQIEALGKHKAALKMKLKHLTNPALIAEVDEDVTRIEEIFNVPLSFNNN